MVISYVGCAPYSVRLTTRVQYKSELWSDRICSGLKFVGATMHVGYFMSFCRHSVFHTEQCSFFFEQLVYCIIVFPHLDGAWRNTMER